MIDRLREPPVSLRADIVAFCLRDAADKFQDLAHKGRVRVNLFCGDGGSSVLEEAVDEEEEEEAEKRDRPDPDIEGEKHRGDESGFQDALR